MHTQRIEAPSGRWVVNHDGSPAPSSLVQLTSPQGASFNVPFGVLKEFVGRMMIQQAISALESADGSAFLDIASQR